MSVFDTPNAIPNAITSGEAVSWADTLTDYPVASYSVAYKFAGQTPQDGWQTFSLSGTESGTATYTFTTGTSIKPGVYAYERQITRTSDSVMRVDGTGFLVVAANLATAPTTTAAATMLAALETAITTLSTTVNASVSFNSQSFTKADMGRLLEQRIKLQAEVYREQQKVAALGGNAQSGFVAVRFAGPAGV